MKIDILFFVEHIDRELRSARALCKNLSGKYGYSSLIKSIYCTGFDILKYKPKLVVIPYAVNEKDKFIRLIKYLYQNKTEVLCLNLEQILNESNRKFKRPDTNYIKSDIKHIAWSKSFKEYLSESGVVNKNIIVASKLSDILFRNSESNKEIFLNTLKKKYPSLDWTKENIFFPLNYNWAFIKSKDYIKKIEQGYDRKLAKKYRSYSKKALNRLLDDLISFLDDNESYNLIIRPHPGVSISNYNSLLKKKTNKNYKNLLVTDFSDVYKWCSISKYIVSNWSTVIFDAAKYGHDCYQYGSESFPIKLELPIYNEVKQIEKLKQIKQNILSERRNKKDEINPLKEYSIIIDSIIKDYPNYPKREYDVASLILVFLFQLRKMKLKLSRLLGYEDILNQDVFEDISY